MDFDQSNEEHLRYLEEYIKRFHLYNGIIEEEAQMLANILVYWHRKNVPSKSKKKFDCFRYGLKNLIDDYKAEFSMSSFEILDVLYKQIEDMISTLEEQRTREGLIRLRLFAKDGRLIIKVII